MSHGHTRIASKSSCIYCGRSDVPLTDEHIVPLSLGGQHVIENASCSECAKITTKFERDVAREMWGDARIHYDAPSRRKKQRPSHIVLHDPDDQRRKVKVPYSEYPAPIIFYTMNRAGLLEGMPNTLDISSMWQFSAVTDDAKAKNFEKRFGIKLTVRFRHVPESFARLIAKIGYGQILTSLDPGDFRPICLPYILGEQKNLSYIVGGRMQPAEPDTGMGYVLRTVGFGDESRLMLVAEVRLYANAHTPTYHVVVGDVVGRDRVAAVWQKIGDGEIDAYPAASSLNGIRPGQPHWMPQTWPLPFWTE